MFRRAIPGSLALLFVLLALVPPATAQEELNWSIAQREPQDIKAFVERVMEVEENAPGAEDAPGVMLYRQIFADMKVGGMQVCRNWILRVNDPSILVDRVLNPYTDSFGEIFSLGAFRYRDGKLRQLYGREIQIQAADPPRRARALLDWVDLKAGDIIGVSIIASYEEPISIAYFPAVSPVPVVRCNLRIRTDGYNTYTILGHRGEEFGFHLKVDGLKNGEPAEWQGSMNYLPAFPDLPLSPPYAPEVPTFTVIHVATYTSMPGISRGWFSTVGWRQVALRLAMIEEAAATFGVEVQDKALEVAGSLSSDAEKEKAVFDFVHQKVELLEGYEYDPRSKRRPSEVLADMSGTAWEKILLMQAMLQQVGVDGQLGGIRTAAWGPLDEELPSYQNFQELALRYGDDAGRWYAPQAPDASGEGLPASWGTCIALTPKPGLMNEAFEFNMVVQQKIVERANEDINSVSPELIQQKIDEVLEDQGWYRIETVSPH